MRRQQRLSRALKVFVAVAATGLGLFGSAATASASASGPGTSAEAQTGKFGGQGPITPVPGYRNSLTAATTITRSDVIKRAQSWVNKGLVYDQTRYYQGYRKDCSGYASMAWNLPDSEVTGSFVPNGYAEWISKSDLKAGDALNNDDTGNYGHITLFEKWADSGQTSYWGYEFTKSGVHHRVINYPYYPGYGTFRPMRYKNIVDDSAPLPEAPSVEPSQRVNADFNGDGRDDVAAVYGYDDGTVSLFTWLSRADGGFADPVKSWSRPPGNWTFKSMKMTAGDYNGDGRADVAGMYDYADGSVALFTWLSAADGTFGSPTKSWTTEPGNWYPEHVQLASGDFDGNGRDDVAAFYGYSDGRAALYTFKSTASGGFSTPLKSWNVPAAYWWGEHVKFTSGDFNGDGRTDTAALYGYDDGTVSLFTWLGRADGGFADPVKSWTRAPGNWTFESVSLTSGDYNGDGRTDLAGMYDYADGSVALFTWPSSADGTFATDTKSWTTEPGNWYPEHVQLASGDFDGNGRDDVAAFYGYSDGRAALFTFKSTASGGFSTPLKSWNVPAAYWWGEHVKFV